MSIFIIIIFLSVFKYQRQSSTKWEKFGRFASWVQFTIMECMGEFCQIYTIMASAYLVLKKKL